MVNEFHDFDEGPLLLDLYFGDDRPSLLVNALIVGLFYAGSLLLALAFLQPRRSRLRILEQPPPPTSSSWSSASVAAAAAVAPGGEERGCGRVRIREGGWHERGGKGGEELKEGGGGYGGVALKEVPGDPNLLQASNGNGPLYFLEEGGRVRNIVWRRGRGGGGVGWGLPSCVCPRLLGENRGSTRRGSTAAMCGEGVFLSVAATVEVCPAWVPTAVCSHPCPLARYFECQKSSPMCSPPVRSIGGHNFPPRRRVSVSPLPPACRRGSGPHRSINPTAANCARRKNQDRSPVASVNLPTPRPLFLSPRPPSHHPRGCFDNSWHP